MTGKSLRPSKRLRLLKKQRKKRIKMAIESVSKKQAKKNYLCSEILLLVDLPTPVQGYCNKLPCSSPVTHLVAVNTFTVLLLYPLFMPVLLED